MKIVVVKIGGNIIDDDRLLCMFLSEFSKIKSKKILVHGGGKTANSILQELGHKIQMVEGRRVTDAKTLDIISGIYGGKINKKIVAILQGYSCNALGLSGMDGNIIRGTKRQGWGNDYGYVGDNLEVDGKQLTMLLGIYDTLVVSPLTHDGNGQILNTNADSISSAVALSLHEFSQKSIYASHQCEGCGRLHDLSNVSNSISREASTTFENNEALKGMKEEDFSKIEASIESMIRIIFCFEMDGVMLDVSDHSSKIDSLCMADYNSLKEQKIISSGMIPKLDNCYEVLQGGVGSVQIGSAMDVCALASQAEKTGESSEECPRKTIDSELHPQEISNESPGGLHKLSVNGTGDGIKLFGTRIVL